MKESINKIRHLTYENMEELLNINPRKVILWCGAGISVSTPSCLPLGKTLVDFVLEQLLGKEFVKELYKKLENIDNVLIKQNISIGNCLRLESVISEILQIEQSLKPGNENHLVFSASLREIAKAPFNLNHEIIV